MKYITYILLVILGLFSCTTNTQKTGDNAHVVDSIHSNQNITRKTTLEESLHKQANADLKLITKASVIIISPTDKKIDSLKTKNGEDNFYTIADDNQWYIGNARIYLDFIQVKPIDVESKGIMQFKGANGEISKVDLETYSWGILLFDGKNKPIDIDITIFEAEYNKYMKK